MTNNEAIEKIECAKAEVEWNYPLDYAVAFDMAIEALEKQIPKKPGVKVAKELVNSDNPFGVINVETFMCPCCRAMLMYNTHIGICLACGQHIDWSEEE